MPKTKEDLRILLVQIRKDEDVVQSERKNFLDHMGISGDQLHSLNILKHHDIPMNFVQDFDGLLVGGMSDDPSGELYLQKDDFPFIGPLSNLINQAIEHNIPSLLSCGGFMLATQILGGELTLDQSHSEMDITPIFWTEEGMNDPLLRGQRNPTFMVSGHLKSTIKLPPGSIRLAYSKRCPIHAFRIKDKPFYAFQGHPEVTSSEIKQRIEPYKHKYFASIEEYRRFLTKTESTSDANQIMHRFVELTVDYLS